MLLLLSPDVPDMTDVLLLLRLGSNSAPTQAFPSIRSPRTGVSAFTSRDT
jgi:hypothetical protein